jgi:hypothetical protein
MNYVFKAVLRNGQHPENGVVTIPFPIPREEYHRNQIIDERCIVQWENISSLDCEDS